jgi:kynurenine formamidase
MAKIYDLSVVVNSETKSPPSTNITVDLTRHNRGPGFWQVTSVAMGLHTGAHIDSPLHCYEDGLTTAEIPLDLVIGQASVIDCTNVGESEPVDVAVLVAGMKDVREGDIIILHTGWADKAYGDFPRYFVDSPYITPEASEWIVAKKPSAIAFDFFEEFCARLPDFGSEDFVCHRILLGAGIPMLEGMRNVAAVGKPRFDFYAPFYNIQECDGAPARFFAKA